MNDRDHEPSTSPSLLQSAKDGNRESWQRLAQIYGPVVYGWARRCGCQAADAADVMQETLTAMTTAMTGFDHQRDGATFRGWLWTITRNKLRDRRRRGEGAGGIGGTEANLQLQQVADSRDPTASIDASIEADQPPSELAADLSSVRSRALQLIREKFDPRSWQMFWETEALGRPPAEVAQDMGVSKWAVYKARARVLSRLRHELDGIG